ncbi:efflux RND transporter permease subunit [Thermoflavifilum thermophilum]|uniref:Hydrophobic/amphiphilic exporter-1, HAE1 family n=1 Tax=Thermoflavifilum thermophilum TaxID=1393122 RepID=A0A1I7N225_9BACT|nr:multidrug efflux RND transporter permease subunit [Thermoflavifilum thermophilum]SFV28717.1 hydrophobic/amphiphilic exporter-1, HAE1 family [Thermoflavifilum thermophilum]
MIANVFIRRPITAIVIAIIITLLGVLSILNLPISQYPDITPPVVTVSANYTGADAQTVEQTVTTPIETQVNGTPGMEYMQSTSTSSGTSSINVTFNLGTNVDIAALDVQNRVSVAAPQLPSEVQRLGVTVRKRNPSILMLVALYSPHGTHSAEFLSNYANIYVKDALLRVNGVGDVFTRGADFSMRVWLKPDKLAALGLTPGDVVAALQSQNLQVAAGSIGMPPQDTAQAFQYTVFTNSRLSKPEDFANVVIRSDPQTGALVHLKDVARVELGKFSYDDYSYVDGKRATFLLIFQTPNSNALETYQGVVEAMKQLKKTFPSDVDYMIPFEAVSVIQVSIHEVVITLLEALILVILVVFLFLQNWRATLIPVLVIPVSIIGTFTFFTLLGFTINKLTLFGFVLAIGIVVDDAIVVTEAVEHYMSSRNIPAKEATILAMKDISGPVIAIALILASVFIPVGFIPGIVGKLYQQFAITIAISVLISAFLALSLTPALCTLLLKPMEFDEHSRGLNRFFYLFNRWFRKTTLNYTVAVRKAIAASKYIIILLVCIIVAAILLFKHKPTGFIPTEDEGRLYITFELPEAASTTRTVQVLDSIMHILQQTPGVGHFAGLASLNVVTFSTKSNSGTIFCQLKPWDERKSKSEQLFAIIGQLQRRFAAIKDANIVVIPPPAIPGLGATGGFTFEIEDRAGTDDLQTFESVIRRFVAAANQRPEISNAFTFFTAHTPSYRVDVDRDQCEKMGVNIADVYSTLQTYLGSSYVNDFTIYGRNFRVVAQADTQYRSTIHDLSDYYVRNNQGQMIPLSNLVTYRTIETAPLISHYNLFRSAEVNGNAAPGYSSGDAIKALQEVAAQVLPNGYGYEFSGLSREEIQAGSKTVYIFMLSVIFVFLLLAALYESWSVPFAVLLAVPLAAFGAILTLTFTPSLSNSVYAQIGLVTLIGLAAKNAILIVEFAKERVDRGMQEVNATLEASQLRLRPILMTSLAFIFGVAPLALATGAGAVSRQTIGFTVLGGMLAATLLGIFTVPVLFVSIIRLAYGKEKLRELQSRAAAEEMPHEPI